jgi:Phage major capsid protein E
MAAVAELEARLEALRAQRDSAVARVSYDGRSVEYRGTAEIARAIAELERELQALEGKQAVDQQFARWVMLHVQSNPLPICTRPRVLIKGKRT